MARIEFLEISVGAKLSQNFQTGSAGVQARVMFEDGDTLQTIGPKLIALTDQLQRIADKNAGDQLDLCLARVDTRGRGR